MTLMAREQARALIAEHGIVALDRASDHGAKYQARGESDRTLYLRLGNGRVLWREDSVECHGESWELLPDAHGDGT